MSDSLSGAVLYAEDVRSWVQERATLVARQTEIALRLEQLNGKLEAVRLLLPASVARELLGTEEFRPPVATREALLAKQKRVERPVTDLLMDILAGEKGGRDVGWFRERMLADPKLAPRITKSPTAISNGLLRLKARGKVKKAGRLYYLPEMLAKIVAGAVEEEHAGNVQAESYSSIMYRVMAERGGKFTAGEAIAAAKSDPVLAAQLIKQPSYVYSWLSREAFKNKLNKDGDFYSLPSNGNGRP